MCSVTVLPFPGLWQWRKDFWRPALHLLCQGKCLPPSSGLPSSRAGPGIKDCPAASRPPPSIWPAVEVLLAAIRQYLSPGSTLAFEVERAILPGKSLPRWSLSKRMEHKVTLNCVWESTFEGNRENHRIMRKSFRYNKMSPLPLFMCISYMCVRLVLLYSVIFLLRPPFPLPHQQRPVLRGWVSSNFYSLPRGSFSVRKMKLGSRVLGRREKKIMSCAGPTPLGLGPGS